jgi:hypothetical protein
LRKAKLDNAKQLDRFVVTRTWIYNAFRSIDYFCTINRISG